MNGLEYKTLTSIESCGASGAFGVKILVATGHDLDLKSDAMWIIGNQAKDMILEELKALSISKDPEKMGYAKKEKEELLAIFDTPIFVEEIPNGYCSQGCCRHLPWFIVTTSIGRIKIGWRKRVISIDWSDSPIKTSISNLFPEEDVTKGDGYIHAWNLEKAKQYIQVLLSQQIEQEKK